MKNINSKYLMMLLTLAVGSSKLQASEEYVQQKSSYNQSDKFLKKMNQIERDLHEISASRKDKCQSELNMDLDAMQIAIDELNLMDAEHSLHDHHIRRLNDKLAHVRRKCAHYYNELAE